MNHVPGPYRLVKVPAGGWVIEAKLRHSKGQSIAQIFEVPVIPKIKYADLRDGIVYVEIAYSSWYQFEIGDWNEKTWEANAKLLASAPDLLIAHNELLDICAMAMEKLRLHNDNYAKCIQKAITKHEITP